MSNENSDWFFQTKCSACDRMSATIRLIYDHETLSGPNEVLLIFDTPGGSSEPGWKITVDWGEKIKAAFTPPHTIERIRLADFADDAGFCGDCSQFYCWSHWNVLSSGVGWCPKVHPKTLDPYCAYEAD